MYDLFHSIIQYFSPSSTTDFLSLIARLMLIEAQDVLQASLGINNS